jgi:membrane protease subunit HflK
MAWNEPGKRDPWRGKDQGPDVEETLRKLKDGVGRLFGGGGSGGGFAMFVGGLLLALLVLDSWSVINAREVGVVLRFGQFSRVLTPGFNLKWPRPIEQVIKVETTKIRSVQDNVRMLTNDENIVLIDFNVQFQVVDAQKFLFKLRDPESTLKQAAESAVRQVMGASEMDTILSGQGSELVSETKKVLQQTLDVYEAGLQVTEVNFQNVAPPHEVKEAFDDVTNARENKQQIENDAHAYANNVVPVARGEAARIKAEAEGYRAERIARAQGDSDRFTQLVTQYHAAPEVTRRRLYLETMQGVLADSAKVLDMSNGKNLNNLPLNGAPLDTARAGALLQGEGRKEGSR